MRQRVLQAFDTLFSIYGKQFWWPGDTVFEICVGAILTQNTNWGNVEKAMALLQTEGLMSAQAMRDCSSDKLAECIRPSGYFNQKTRKLQAFLQWLDSHNDDENIIAEIPADRLRTELLDIWGVGEETADSMMLYGFHKPVFVVDAYTRRLVERHHWLPSGKSYADIQHFFIENTDISESYYNEFHALIVLLGKNFCKPKPDCENCPLKYDL